VNNDLSTKRVIEISSKGNFNFAQNRSRSPKSVAVQFLNRDLMVNVISVFVRTEEATGEQLIIGRPMADGVNVHYCTARENVRTERILSEVNHQALKAVREFAASKNLRVRVYDVSRFKRQLKASLIEVKTTPAAVFGKAKFEGSDILVSLKRELEC
jgi:hypothetical protein